jgi:hypothetical protein
MMTSETDVDLALHLTGVVVRTGTVVVTFIAMIANETVVIVDKLRVR